MGNSIGDVDGWTKVKARTALKTDDGGKNLRQLFEVSKKINFALVTCFCSAFEKTNWQIDPASFKEKHDSAWRTMERYKNGDDISLSTKTDTVSHMMQEDKNWRMTKEYEY